MKGTVAVLGLACAVASSAAAESQWDLPTNYGASAFHTKNIAQFATDVDKATSGSLKIAVHPGGAMIKHAEIKRAVSDGKAAAGEVLISLAADEAPVYGVDSIPLCCAKALSRKAAREGRIDPSVFGAVAATGNLRQA